jgi:hypothetical protein
VQCERTQEQHDDEKEDDEGVRKEVEVRVGIKGSHHGASSVLTLSPSRSVDRSVEKRTYTCVVVDRVDEKT